MSQSAVLVVCQPCLVHVRCLNGFFRIQTTSLFSIDPAWLSQPRQLRAWECWGGRTVARIGAEVARPTFNAPWRWAPRARSDPVGQIERHRGAEPRARCWEERRDADVQEQRAENRCRGTEREGPATRAPRRDGEPPVRRPETGREGQRGYIGTLAPGGQEFKVYVDQSFCQRFRRGIRNRKVYKLGGLVRARRPGPGPEDQMDA